MIEIDRSKCKKMLVWDGRSPMLERIVICFDGERYLCVDHAYEDKFKEGGNYPIVKWTNAKPLPEPKPMTALDVTYWYDNVTNGRSIIIEHEQHLDSYTLLFDIEFPNEDVSQYRWNELIRENGETKLKYEEWKPFTFDECDMGEG